MIHTILIFAALASNTSMPHRPADFTIISGQSRDDLTLCAAHSIKTVPIVLEKKSVIDHFLKGLVSKESFFSLIIEERGENREISALYRKPFNRMTAIASIRSIAKKCFAAEFNDALIKQPVEKIKPL